MNIKVIAKLHKEFHHKNTTTQLLSHKICLRAWAKFYFNNETNWGHNFPFNNNDTEPKENKSYKIQKGIFYNNLLEHKKKWKATKAKLAGLIRLNKT